MADKPEYDYGARVAEADLTTNAGIGDFLAKALKDWRDEEIDDLKFDDLVQRTVSALANDGG
jgi:hypothetical protein